MKKFDNELAEMRTRLIEMGDLARQMVRIAADAVKDRTRDLHADVTALEDRLDQMQVEIDANAVRMLTVYGPVAHDLRYVLVANHVTAQLERMGDQVVNICESLRLMRSEPDHATLPELHKMAGLACEMVDDALQAYFEQDPEKAAATRSHDDIVDALNAQVMKKLLSDEVLHQVLRGTEDIADALAQILISRHLERIADQAVNICKEVIYMVRGDDVRHRQST